MKPTTGYALPYSDDRCFFLFKNSMRSLFKPMRKNHSDQLILHWRKKDIPFGCGTFYVSFHSIHKNTLLKLREQSCE